MAGYHRDDSLGGLFVSEDAGMSWSQIFLEVSLDGQDVNVRDIIFYDDGIFSKSILKTYTRTEYYRYRAGFRVTG